MRVRRLTMRNFRGVKEGRVDFPQHTLLVGGNNVGKSTVCEALELVLGPERLSRRPVIDEHDFYAGQYLDASGKAIEITITAVLTDLSEEARNRFHLHLRPWDEAANEFADETGGPVTSKPVWSLPIIFIGRYDRDEDDFVGNTFFEHPVQAPETSEEAQNEPFTLLGAGRTTFGREHKRYCGFVFLRALRTGSRALSLQRGSLLDTILRLGGGGLTEMWQDTLDRLRDLDPAIGDIPKLQQIRTEIQTRLSRFISLAEAEDPTAFFASELTREHLREVVRLFVGAQPGSYLVPFNHLGTGSVNLLVFALLTFIADLKGTKNVIFAMEEPEIALPPHTQRRVTRFVLHEMGQSIVTSHSPYVIEQFEPDQIVLLDRTNAGVLGGRPVDVGVVKPKAFRTERRQFAEAILSRAVLVVEGATEAVVFPAASSVLESSLGADLYTHIDLAGVTVFDAGADNSVPRYGPMFAALGKTAFAFYDPPNKSFDADAIAKLATYAEYWESPESGIEKLLSNQTAEAAVRRFLKDVNARADYPTKCGQYHETLTEDDMRDLARRVLEARKGDSYAYGAMLIAQCQDATEIPAMIRQVLEKIHATLSPPQTLSPPPSDTGGPATIGSTTV